MTPFLEQIKQFEPSEAEAKQRRWIYVPYDRLHDRVGPLSETSPDEAIVVLMESRAKGTRRDYHKRKLTLVLSAMRHFALEQAQRGCRVVYGASPASFSDGLLALQERWQWKELVVNRPAERELRVELREAGGLVSPERRSRPVRVEQDRMWRRRFRTSCISGSAMWHVCARCPPTSCVSGRQSFRNCGPIRVAPDSGFTASAT